MTTTLSIRIDRELKENVEKLLSDLGMNVTTAINCFFRKMLAEQAIPFSIGRRRKAALADGSFRYRETEEGHDAALAVAEAAPLEGEVPNAETLRAIDDLDNNRKLSRYSSVDAMLKDVL